MVARRVCFLLERADPPRPSPVVDRAIALLTERGASVSTVYPEELLWRLDRLSVEADVYVLKSNTELALSLAAALEGIGARVVNSHAATARTTNKVRAAGTLIRAGIPTPRSLATARPSQLTAEVASGCALILKPHRGHFGKGIVVARSPADLPTPDAFSDRDLVFAQDYLAGANTDLKVYVIGETVLGVRKPFVPGTSFARTGEPAPLAPAVEQIAWQVGQAFGLELYGLDVAEDEDGGAYVIDVNAAPSYRGLPSAADRLVDYILSSRDIPQPTRRLDARAELAGREPVSEVRQSFF